MEFFIFFGLENTRLKSLKVRGDAGQVWGAVMGIFVAEEDREGEC